MNRKTFIGVLLYVVCLFVLAYVCEKCFYGINTLSSSGYTETTTNNEEETKNSMSEESTTDMRETETMPTSDTSTTEEPTAEEPTTEKPTTEEPTTEEPTTEEPTAEEPTAEEPTTEEPTVDTSTTEETTSETSVTEEPTSEASTTEEPTSETSTIEESTSEDSATEESTEDTTEKESDISTDPEKKIVYAIGEANIRTAPTTKATIVGKTYINQEFVYIEKNNGWCKLLANGAEVYIYGDYIGETPTKKAPKDNPYTYEKMVEDISRLQEKYDTYYKAEVLGTTYDDRNMYLLTIGNPDAEKSVLFTAAIHGAEYITSQLVMAQIEYYLDNREKQYDGMSIGEILNNVCIYVIPMVNPDGVAISQTGLFAINNLELREKLYKIGYTEKWSSNARGVDINRNFPTVGFGIDNGPGQDYSAPSFKYYEGDYPASEQETQIIMNFVSNTKNLQAYISYHCKGEVIYWNKGQKGELYKDNADIVELISGMTGYKNIKGLQTKSGIDYEWAILELGIPGCTVETGRPTADFPVRQTEWADLWKKNQNVMIAVGKNAIN